MTNIAETNLTREKIQQLLAAVGSQSDTEEPQPEYTELSWKEPHCFSTHELEKINTFLDHASELIAQKFKSSCHFDFNITINSTSQCYADDFLAAIQSSEQKCYYLAFGTEPDKFSSVLGMPMPTAICWINLLLQDAEADENTDRDLSELEESFLLDIASIIIEALSQAYSDNELQTDEKVVHQQLPIALESIEKVFKIDFTIEQVEAKKKTEAFLIIPSGLLNPVAGRPSDTKTAFSEEQVSQAILDHLQNLPVSVCAQLGAARLTFEDVMNLNTSDILLLDTKVDEPALLRVDGEGRFHCSPAQANGNFAVVITDVLLDKIEPIN